MGRPTAEDIEWVEEMPVGHSRLDYNPIYEKLAVLKLHSGQPAIVARFDSKQGASNVCHRLRQIEKYKSFTFTPKRQEDGGSTLYARHDG